MAHISWDKVFAGETPGKGATDAELQELAAALGKPLSAKELESANDPKANPSPETVQQTAHDSDPRSWRLPTKPLPPSYLSFLKWSNGGSFYNGARAFNFLSTSMVREFALKYRFPEHMAGALPIAFDAGDDFYVFDMRSDPVHGEYPILIVRGGKPSHSDAVHVADSFVELCKGTTDPEKLLED